MSLYEKLQSARTEEDVKDAYIRALGLKNYSKNLIDIQTNEIWFEAKDKPTSSYAMFTQLLHYVQVALNKGEPIPPFLAVIDTEKAALMQTADVIPFLARKTIKWGKSASQYSQEALDAVSSYIGTYFVSFRLKTHEPEFITTVREAIRSGVIIRTQITPDNLKQVFDKWVEMIGREIAGVPEDKYNLLFFADVMSDGTVSTHENLPAELLHRNNAPIFILDGKLYPLGNREGYRQFWAIYHRPPAEEYRNYLLERRDSLIPLDERSFKGAFYTPLHVVDKAYDKLSETLGKNWQRDYIVWDMCCGVGNLEVKHSNHRNIFMSTLDQADVDVMRATRTCVAATRFQYDYLNDDINEFGQIDYGLTNKMPQALRDAIADANAGKPGAKKILVLINPPYAEAANSQGNEGKTDVAATKIGLLMRDENYGYAARELFVQFMARVAKEIPNAALAMFSTLKYVNAPNFENFRANWNAEFKDGFIVHSKAFDGLNGNFPIGFLIWQTNQNAMIKTPIKSIEVDVLDKAANPIGSKLFYNLPNKEFLSLWMSRLKTDGINIPLKNAIYPQTNFAKVTAWSSAAIGYLLSNSNDPQHAGTLTALFSSVCSQGNGYYITPDNLWQAAIVFAVRRLIKPTWINDRDQFLQPSVSLPEEFKRDCLIWMLFNGSNLTASADGLEWNGRQWSIVNHFIPFTEDEVNAPDRFESDFMVRYLSSLPPLNSTGPNDLLPLQGEVSAERTEGEAHEASPTRQTLRVRHPPLQGREIESGLPRKDVIANSAIATRDRDAATRNFFLPLQGEVSAERTEGEAHEASPTRQTLRVRHPPLQGRDKITATHRQNEATNLACLSPEAQAVLDAGRTLWRAYFSETPPFIVRNELKLNRADVGWYQIRNALKRRNETGDSVPVDFSVFEGAYRELGDKLRPSVYEYGFLKP